MSNVAILGDLHLYYDKTEVGKAEAVVDRLTENPPDTIVLGGDIYELWRRDLAGVMWGTDWFTQAIRDLTEQGTRVEYIIGNHDAWMLRHTSDAIEYPFDISVDYTFSSGGKEFFVTHGHKYEPQYNPLTNDILSITDDWIGSFIGRVWENRPLPGNLVERGFLAAAGPGASYLDPEHTSKSRLRREIIHGGIEAESGPETWGIYGHTHIPFVDEESKLANWGSFTAGRATYLEITDGNVRLVDLFG